MIKEVSAGIILYFKNSKNKKINYLLLKYKGLTGKIYWGLVKGQQEKGEPILKTAKREVKEETGLTIKKIDPSFKREESYFFKRDNHLIFKKVIYFLAKTPSKKISLSKEHMDYKWVTLEEAKKLLEFKNLKEILENAEEYLQRQSITSSKKNKKRKGFNL